MVSIYRNNGDVLNIKIETKCHMCGAKTKVTVVCLILETTTSTAVVNVDYQNKIQFHSKTSQPASYPASQPASQPVS